MHGTALSARADADWAVDRVDEDPVIITISPAATAKLATGASILRETSSAGTGVGTRIG
jgi:hypothetical protein